MKLIFTLAATAVFNQSPLNASSVYQGIQCVPGYTPHPNNQAWSGLLKHLPSPFLASAKIESSVPTQHITHSLWLLNFTATKIQNNTQLKWTIAENEKALQFEVEKSTENNNFSTLGIVPATERTGIEAYQLTEKGPMQKNEQYRLKLVNKDGSTAYSQIIYLKSNLVANPIQHL